MQDGEEYRNAFWRVVTTADPRELEPDDLVELRTMSRATGAAGGFRVPPDLADQIVRAERFLGSIAAISTVYDTDSGETLNVPANTAHGAATWIAENAAWPAGSDERRGVQRQSSSR